MGSNFSHVILSGSREKIAQYNSVHFIDILALAYFSLIIGGRVSPVLLDLALKLLTALLYTHNY